MGKRLLGVMFVLIVNTIANATPPDGLQSTPNGKDEKVFIDENSNMHVTTLSIDADKKDSDDEKEIRARQSALRAIEEMEFKFLSHSSSSSSSGVTGLTDECSRQTHASNSFSNFSNVLSQIRLIVSRINPFANKPFDEIDQSSISNMPDPIKEIITHYLSIRELPHLASAPYMRKIHGHGYSIDMILYLLRQAKEKDSQKAYWDLKIALDGFVEDINIINSNFVAKRSQTFPKQIQEALDQVTQLLLEKISEHIDSVGLNAATGNKLIPAGQMYMLKMIIYSSQNQPEIQNAIFELIKKFPKNYYPERYMGYLASRTQLNPKLRARIYNYINSYFKNNTDVENFQIIANLAAATPNDSKVFPTRVDLFSKISNTEVLDVFEKTWLFEISDDKVKTALKKGFLEKENLSSDKNESILDDIMRTAQNDIANMIQDSIDKFINTRKGVLLSHLMLFYFFQPSPAIPINQATLDFLKSNLTLSLQAPYYKLFVYAALANHFKNDTDLENNALKYLHSSRDNVPEPGSTSTPKYDDFDSYWFRLSVIAAMSTELSPGLQKDLLQRLQKNENLPIENERLRILAHRAQSEEVQDALFTIAETSPHDSTSLISGLAASSIENPPRQERLLKIVRNLKNINREDKKSRLSVIKPLVMSFPLLSASVQNEVLQILLKTLDNYDLSEGGIDVLRVLGLLESVTLPSGTS